MGKNEGLGKGLDETLVTLSNLSERLGREILAAIDHQHDRAIRRLKIFQAWWVVMLGFTTPLLVIGVATKNTWVTVLSIANISAQLWALKAIQRRMLDNGEQHTQVRQMAQQLLKSPISKKDTTRDKVSKYIK